MPRYAYVNGRYVPHGRATIHIEDRGYQFADGIYEVVPVAAGRPVEPGGEGGPRPQSMGFRRQFRIVE